MSSINRISIKAIGFDFDGVFTDNRVILSQDGIEFSICNRYDGYGLKNLKRYGINMCCITSEIIPISVHRCRKLSLTHFCVGTADKLSFLTDWLEKIKVLPKDAAYLGNDINDISCLQFVGHPFCPADAHHSVFEYAQRLSRNGGHGVVRELADLITDGAY